MPQPPVGSREFSGRLEGNGSSRSGNGQGGPAPLFLRSPDTHAKLLILIYLSSSKRFFLWITRPDRCNVLLLINMFGNQF
jgi:hypothetical protein